MDRFTPEERSEIMRRVRGANTGPELVVRKLVYSLGFRYRLQCRDLPGRPDLVFRKLGKVIFVHGCFWHQHAGCVRSALPKSHAKYWKDKLLKNVERDSAAIKELRRQGWKVLILWECQLACNRKLERLVSLFLK
jgi:DNA mismatch endonuclease (patch repair protein)